MNNAIITRQPIAEDHRINHTADIFGVYFPMRVEPLVYAHAGNMAPEYDGGYWEFYALSNGGFYMAPAMDKQFQVCCENGFEGLLSADALGIAVCLYAYSNLSFSGINGFTETCAQQYHWLREFMLGHPEARCVLGAID
ncbi:Antirestriction protein [Nitrosomonas aestuarii]|uniref:Antirestriction protein n=1 Tax=Nitrosomonas aestuarii TaxID=52441 RepID=A0A1I4GGL0_9PROT|nr:antirestriction protein [Nitrosomonas aestuarii]SFL28999.1 Antirestriction protein [Nitrosomonas aestuarii]